MPHQAVRARCRSEQLQFLDLGPDDENHLFWRPPRRKFTRSGLRELRPETASRSSLVAGRGAPARPVVAAQQLGP